MKRSRQIGIDSRLLAGQPGVQTTVELGQLSPTSRHILGLTQPHIQRLPGFSPDLKRSGNKDTAHFHGTVQNLGASETVPLLPLYVFMSCRGTT